MKVMLVDDEPSFHVLVQSVCESAGHEFRGVGDSRQAIEVFKAYAPDVVLLDIMMPYLDGYQVCEGIRALDSEVAVVFLSAKGAVPDKREAFSRGADDYLVKPFDGEELLMRLEALQRRSQRAKAQAAPAPSETLKVGEFEFDSVRQTLALNGTSVQLTPKEFQILYTLALKPETVMSKEELIPRRCHLHCRVCAQDSREDRTEPRKAALFEDGMGHGILFLHQINGNLSSSKVLIVLCGSSGRL